MDSTRARRGMVAEVRWNLDGEQYNMGERKTFQSAMYNGSFEGSGDSSVLGHGTERHQMTSEIRSLPEQTLGGELDADAH